MNCFLSHRRDAGATRRQCHETPVPLRLMRQFTLSVVPTPYGTHTFFCASFPSDKSLGYYQNSLRDNVLLNDVVTRICVVQRGLKSWAIISSPYRGTPPSKSSRISFSVIGKNPKSAKLERREETKALCSKTGGCDAFPSQNHHRLTPAQEGRRGPPERAPSQSLF